MRKSFSSYKHVLLANAKNQMEYYSRNTFLSILKKNHTPLLRKGQAKCGFNKFQF